VLFILFKSAYPTVLTKDMTAILLAYAAMIEIIQYFLPTRYASWSDIAADAAGLVLGYFIFFLCRRFFI